MFGYMTRGLWIGIACLGIILGFAWAQLLARKAGESNPAAGVQPKCQVPHMACFALACGCFGVLLIARAYESFSNVRWFLALCVGIGVFLGVILGRWVMNAQIEGIIGHKGQQEPALRFFISAGVFVCAIPALIGVPLCWAEFVRKGAWGVAPEEGKKAQAAYAQPDPVNATDRPPLNINAFNAPQPQSLPTPQDYPGERYPQTRQRILTLKEWSGSSVSDLQYAINEMFARHGADFPDEMRKRQFSRFAWYRPLAGVSFDDIEARYFTSLERENLKVLAEARRLAGSRSERATPRPAPSQRPSFTPGHPGRH